MAPPPGWNNVLSQIFEDHQSGTRVVKSVFQTKSIHSRVSVWLADTSVTLAVALGSCCCIDWLAYFLQGPRGKKKITTQQTLKPPLDVDELLSSSQNLTLFLHVVLLSRVQENHNFFFLNN